MISLRLVSLHPRRLEATRGRRIVGYIEEAGEHQEKATSTITGASYSSPSRDHLLGWLESQLSRNRSTDLQNRIKPTLWD